MAATTPSTAAISAKEPLGSQSGAAVPCAKSMNATPAGRSRYLSEDELNAMFDELDVPEVGRQRIRHIRSSLPARATNSTKYTGKLRYPSLKMGFTMEAEAYTTEMVAITEWDHDDTTREFYTQPDHRLKIRYRSGKSGKMTAVYTVTDAFRITRDAFIFTECKTEEFLETESVRQPDRYARRPDGSWSSPPAEEAAAALGCRFELRSSAVNNWTLHENLELLYDFYVAADQGLRLGVRDEVKKQVLERLEGRPSISAFDLIHVEPRIAADDLYALLAAGEIYFPVTEMRLADQSKALFFRSAEVWHAHKLYIQTDRPERRTQGPRPELRQGDVFDWNGVHYEVVNPGKEQLTARMLNDGNELINLPRKKLESLPETELVVLTQRLNAPETERDERYCTASPDDLKEAARRWQVLFDLPTEDNKLKDRGERARFYWLRAYREAEARWGNGFLGLIPQRVGNPAPKVDEATKKLAREVIERDWEDIRRKKRMTSYGEYRNQCEERGLEPISYATFCRMVAEGKGFEQSASRVGEKAAYDEEPHYLNIERTTPVHGTHSWHIGHIDHTPLPLQFLTEDMRAFGATVWLTLLMGAHDRKIYAYYLSFDEPSYRSCMMVIRDCIRRHGRFFQYVVVDGGSDFQSGYFEKLLSRLYAKKRNRPKGKPRFGSVCERLFGTTQQQFVKVLLGATDIVEQHFRAISREVEPREQAVWVLDRFDSKFQEYIDTVYHCNHHSGLDMSPNEASAYSERNHGSRSFRRLPYDDQFIAETCPAPQRESVTVRPEGVKINYLWYSGPALRIAGVLGTSVHARFDPWHLGRAYVFINRRWEEVRSTMYAAFEGCTERSMKMAAAAMRTVARQRGHKAIVNAQTLARFLRGAVKEEEVARQIRNDAEVQQHRQKIQKVATKPATKVAAPITPPSLTSNCSGQVAALTKAKSELIAQPTRNFQPTEDL